MIHAKDVRYLVFAGGGQRAFAYVGALQALHIPHGQLLGAGGTSMGALIACFVAAGFSPQEIEEEIHRTPIKSALELNIATVWTDFGLDKGLVLRNYIESLLKRKGLGKATFTSLKKKTGVGLTVVAHDLHDDAPVYFSNETTPEVRVSDAVLASMSLPPLFTPQKYDGHYVIDGGCADNFPMSRFPPGQTLGMRVVWKEAVELNSVANYCSRVVYCALSRGDAAQWMRLDEQHRNNTISIDVGDMPIVDWSLPQCTRSELLSAGSKAARIYMSSST